MTNDLNLHVTLIEVENGKCEIIKNFTNLALFNEWYYALTLNEKWNVFPYVFTAEYPDTALTPNQFEGTEPI